jgi:tetratricopeptide (TPR) repeat protein
VEDVRSGNAAFGAGQFEEAVDAYTRAILAGDLDPEALAIASNNRGVAHGELGDYDKAIEDYAQALSLTPGDATATKNLRIAHVRRGGAAQRLGEQEPALADYARAIELEPAHPLAYLRRGQLLLEQGDAAGAVADLRRAQELDPSNQDVGALLADAERAAGSSTAETAAAAPPPAVPEPGAPAAPEAAAPDGTPAPEAAPPAAAALADAVEPGASPVAPEEGGGEPYRVLAEVNYRQGPGNDYPRIGALAQGSTVPVLGEELGWLRIRAPNGETGFVYKKWLEALP